MKKFVTIQNVLLILLVLLFGSGFLIFKQPSPNTVKFQRDNASFDTSSFSQYERGQVEAVIEERVDEVTQNKLLYQHLRVKLTSGDTKGESIETEFTQIIDTAGSFQYKIGDQVVLGQVSMPHSDELLFGNTPTYVIVDRYRVKGLIFAGLLFVLMAFIFARSKGLLSIAGLGVTALILIFFTAPLLLDGKDPVLVAGISSGSIAITTMLIAHGFNPRTKISIISTLVSLAVAIGLSYLLVYGAQLFGFGQADAILLQSGYLGAINLRGLLLAGLIISLLGVLDDVTTAQTATVDELLKANSELSSRELYNSAMSVGREHIASLINTLILVYVGAGLPLFLLLVSASNQPIWVLLNSENIAEEIIRAIAGSTALILSVPISTAIAVWIYKNNAINH